MMMMIFKYVYDPMRLTMQRSFVYNPDINEVKYSCRAMTSALDGGEWQTSIPGRALTPVITAQETGWALELV
jgi:hypothetical protein